MFVNRGQRSLTGRVSAILTPNRTALPEGPGGGGLGQHDNGPVAPFSLHFARVHLFYFARVL